jgi:hypothetical protein
MESHKYVPRNVGWTFFIGFVAGISPFLFMKLLPNMLNPGLHLDPPNYYAIGLTGALIGAITTIIFGATFDKKDPQEVFVYALGIPAILIATVSNLSTQYSAAAEISTVKDTLSSTVLSMPTPDKSEVKLAPVSESGIPSGRGYAITRATWADDQQILRQTVMTAQVATLGAMFYVVIGTYNTNEAATDARQRLASTVLRTERYAPKNLQIKKGATPNPFLLIYGAYSDKQEAQKVYQLLRINDPDLSVRLLED